MRNAFRHAVIGLLMASGLGAVPAVRANAEEQPVAVLRVAVSPAPPYHIIEFEDDVTTFGGFYVEVVEEAARRAGIELEYIVVPFVRVLLMMENGNTDIMLGPNRVPERERYMTYLDVPLPSEDKAFYLAPDAADISKYEDLHGRTVAVLAGAVYFVGFDADRAIGKELVNSYLNSLKMAALGRVDAAIMPEPLGDYLVRTHCIEIRKASYRAEGRTSYIAMSNMSTALSLKTEIEAALRDMVADGSMDDILARYHGVD